MSHLTCNAMNDQIEQALAVLKHGGTILYPTDTVWGIGCDATNAQAVEKVYAVKKSDNKKSMLALVDSIDQAARYVGKVPDVAWQLFEVADKPLTLILPDAAGVAENLIPEEGTIGIRIASDDFCRTLIRRLGRPIVSTSANISGEPAPMYYEDIAKEIFAGVDFAVDPGCEGDSTHKPSAIIKLGRGGEIEIIRD